MAKLFRFFKSSSHKRGDHQNKENNHPLLPGDYHEQNGHLKSALRAKPKVVNFHHDQQRRSYMTDQDDDGDSEVTLTASQAIRQQQFSKLPNPYSVLTEPKRGHATQSLPGGPIQPESTGDGSSGTATLAPNNNDKDAFDRSLEARSEFYPAHPHHPQHRRSSRKQQMMMVVGGSLIDRGGGGGQAIQLQPFNDIGNGRGAPFGRSNGHENGGGVGYKNVGWPAGSSGPGSGDDWSRAGESQRQQHQQHQLMAAQLKEQQKDLNQLEFAYREERARRKGLQRDFRREQEAKERLMMETFRLQSIIGAMLRQQQQQNVSTIGPTSAGFDQMLGAAVGYGGGGGLFPPSWNTPASSTNAPSSSHHHNHPFGTSSSNHQQQQWTPRHAFDLFPFHQQHLERNGRPGECLAAPLLSSSSMLSNGGQQQQQNIGHGHHQPQEVQGRPPSREDEVKVFRTGQHNTDSFSGSSGRPATRELAELERDKDDLVSDSSREQTNFSSPEIGRQAACGKSANRKGQQQHNMTPMLGFSYSAEGLAEEKPSMLLADGLMLGSSSQQQFRDDASGYATSETSGAAAAGLLTSEVGTFGSSNGRRMLRRRSKSDGHLGGAVHRC